MCLAPLNPRKFNPVARIGYIICKAQCKIKMEDLSFQILHPWDFPGKSAGVDCHFLLQGIFSTQESNPRFLHYRWILNGLSHQGSPTGTYLTSAGGRVSTFCSTLMGWKRQGWASSFHGEPFLKCLETLYCSYMYKKHQSSFNSLTR